MTHVVTKDLAPNTRWLGLKFRIEAKSLLNLVETRERIRYSGLGGQSAVNGIERRLDTEGREIEFTVSGSF